MSEISDNKKMEVKKVEIPFGWRRNLGFIKANLFVMWKRILEYKANFYSSILIEIIYFFTTLLFFSVIITNLNSVVPWSQGDLILYSFLTAIVHSISGLVLWKESIKEFIVGGVFNSYLSKPIPTWIFYLFSFLAPPALIFITIDFFLILFIKYYFELIFYNLVISFFVFLLLILLYVCLYYFLISLDLLVLGLTDSIIFSYNRTFEFFERYPIIFFKQAPFKLLLIFLFPIVFIGSLLIPLLRGYEFMFNPFMQVGIIIGLIIIFSLGTWYNWHYGLKKYEAFG